MPQQQAIVVDNQFIEGLKTEYTGLNFPDKACIETFNCIFDKTGLVTNRLGIDYEPNATLTAIDRTGLAISKYFWRNVKGDGAVSLLVMQVGGTVYFYKTSAATAASPLSAQKLASTITLSSFLASGSTSVNTSIECQYTDGNGYLFIFHPNIDPIYVSYNADVLTGTAITIQIRDFEGIVEAGVADNLRVGTLTDDHKYNLGNQGWGKGRVGDSTTSVEIPAEADLPVDITFTVDAGLPIILGDRLRVYTAADIFASIGGDITKHYMIGTVIDYTGTSLELTITEAVGSPNIYAEWIISFEPPLLEIWYDAVGNFPSNSDVWWYYRNETDTFDPADTIDNIAPGAGPAPKGHYILDAFHQNRDLVSGILGLIDVTSGGIRPSTGAWHSGRIFYTGVRAKGFNEMVYFSQIIENVSQFGRAYQTNDPTSSERFDLLPSDGGYIRIQGAGTIHKLTPVANGLLVNADRGVWFITGSQGIGFTANDYTVTKISSVPTISHSSFVDVLGMPMWWNDDGIYTVSLSQQGMSVMSLTDTTIASLIRNIPLKSKLYIRGYYNPFTFIVQWLYRSFNETSVTNRYEFTHILNLDTKTGAFYPWSIAPDVISNINDIVVIGRDDGTLPFKFKYITSSIRSDGSYNFTFSEAMDANYVDFAATAASPFDSYFITGYRIYGKGNLRGQLPFVEIHSNTSEGPSACDLQARWDWASSGDTGRWSSLQRLNFNKTDRTYQSKRIRLRGQGKAVQLKFASVPGEPLRIVGWSTLVSNNTVP